jgi:hypothetical protein
MSTPIISEGNTWTVLDIVAHLVENERGMSIHVHKIRKGQETVPPDFNLNQWNAGLKGRMGHPSPAELLANMADLAGRHPARGVITIAQYYETMAGHDAWHTNDIKKALGLA